MLTLSIMKRRNLLKSIAAIGAIPMIPMSSLVSAAPATGAATVTASAHTYKWAEMIVRAHKKCSPGMLERLLKVDAATASALKSQLLEKGVISAQANSFGIHSAVKPLYEGAFMRPSSEISKGLKKVNETLDKMIENEDALPENDSKFSDLDDEIDSDEELQETTENLEDLEENNAKTNTTT
jgi:hypothetical protein